MQPDPHGKQKEEPHAKPTEAQRQAERKTQFRRFLEHPVTLGVAALTATLIAAGAIFWITNPEGFEQASHYAIPAAGLRVLGALGSMGSAVAKFTGGVALGVLAPFRRAFPALRTPLAPIVRTVRPFIQESEWGLIGVTVGCLTTVIAVPLAMAVGVAKILDKSIEMVPVVYQQYRESRDPQEFQAQEAKKIQNVCNRVKQLALILQKDPSKLAQNSKEAYQVKSEVEKIYKVIKNIRNIKMTIELRELLLQNINALETFNLIYSIYQNNPYTLQDVASPSILPQTKWVEFFNNCVKLFENKRKDFDSQKKAIPKNVNQANVSDSYKMYFSLRVYLEQIQVLQDIIDSTIKFFPKHYSINIPPYLNTLVYESIKLSEETIQGVQSQLKFLHDAIMKIVKTLSS